MANSERPLGVLFLCTGNSARSIMAEALLKVLEGRTAGVALREIARATP